MTQKSFDTCFDCARGLKKSQIKLANCRMVNVLSGEIEENVSIAIAHGVIVGIGGEVEAEETIDCRNQFVYPGLIDAHIHLESTKLAIPEAARLMARCGTSTVIADPHEIANVAALNGIAFQMDSANDNGFVDVLFTAPSCVPTLCGGETETSAADLDAQKLRMLAASPQIVGLGEVMNVPGIINAAPGVLQKIRIFQDAKLVVDGHAPMLSGQALNACIFAGIQSDHESVSLQEAREKLRRGMVVMIREGSSERNLDALIALVDPKGRNVSRLMFASDDLDPTDLMARGHVNYMLKKAVAAGVDPIMAIQMATLSPASYFGIAHRVGAIRPGLCANLVVSGDLRNFDPEMVFHHGKCVYSHGELAGMPQRPLPPFQSTMNVSLPQNGGLKVPYDGASWLRVIEMEPGQISTRETFAEPLVRDGNVVPDPGRDIAKVCVFDRHHASGHFGVAFVRGFGIKQGAMGSSVSHDSHNLIVVGMDDGAILECAERIRAMGGGQAAVAGGLFKAFPMPIAGLMSAASAEDAVEQEMALDAFCVHTLGVAMPRPFAAMSFMALPVIPLLRLTDRGLWRILPGALPAKASLFVDPHEIPARP